MRQSKYSKNTSGRGCYTTFWCYTGTTTTAVIDCVASSAPSWLIPLQTQPIPLLDPLTDHVLWAPFSFSSIESPELIGGCRCPNTVIPHGPRQPSCYSHLLDLSWLRSQPRCAVEFPPPRPTPDEKTDAHVGSGCTPDLTRRCHRIIDLISLRT